MSQIYPYLIAGLPELSFQGEWKGFDFQSVITGIEEQLTGNDAKLLRLLLMGLNTPVPYFYNNVQNSKSHFLREYFAFDCMLRNAQCFAASKKLNTEDHAYSIGEEAKETITDEVKQVMEINNVWEREQKIDQLRWDKAAEITVFNYLDIERILAFVIKASIVNRWMKMDKIKGAELFEQLINEVRGTFDIEKTQEELV